MGKNGELLDRAESAAGMSGIEMSQEFGCSSQQYYKMKRADNGFRYDRLVKLCALPGITKRKLADWLCEIWG